MESKFILPMIMVALLIGGGSFYGGTKYQAAKTPSFGMNTRFAGAAGGQGRGNITGAASGRGLGAGGFTNGEVVSTDANSLTLKLRDGGSKVVYISTSTNIGKMTAGSLSDVVAGNEVSVTGTANQDGSITASMVQIRPAGQIGMPGQRMGSGQAATTTR